MGTPICSCGKHACPDAARAAKPVYVVVGLNHFGYFKMVGVCPDERSARARAKVANRDPDFYLASCEVYAWPVGEEHYTDRFKVWPSSEDAGALRDGLAAKRRADKERSERAQLAALQAKYSDDS
jgi:hypothetical protein